MTLENLRIKDNQKENRKDSCRSETFNASSKAGTKVLVEMLSDYYNACTYILVFNVNALSLYVKLKKGNKANEKMHRVHFIYHKCFF